MAGVDTSAGGVFVAVWETILSAESQSKQGNVRDTPFPQHPDGCDVAARARLQVVAPTAEVVAFTTAQHAVATLHSVAARFGCVKANIHVGDSLSRCCSIVLLAPAALIHNLLSARMPCSAGVQFSCWLSGRDRAERQSDKNLKLCMSLLCA